MYAIFLFSHVSDIRINRVLLHASDIRIFPIFSQVSNVRIFLFFYLARVICTHFSIFCSVRCSHFFCTFQMFAYFYFLHVSDVRIFIFFAVLDIRIKKKFLHVSDVHFCAHCLFSDESQYCYRSSWCSFRMVILYIHKHHTV